MSDENDQENIVDRLILDLMAYLRLFRQRSNLTADAYARDIHEFGAWLTGIPSSKSPMGREYPKLRTASTSDIRRYIMYLTGTKRYSGTTARRKLSSLKALYKYMKLEHLRDDNPATEVPGPPVKSKLPRHFDAPEVERLLHTRPIAGRPDHLRLRDLAIIELLYASGIRRAEVANIGLSDVNLPERIMHVHGKGRKERVVVINHATAAVIGRYLAVRPRTDCDALFVGRGGKRLTPKHVWRIFRDIYDLSGIKKRGHPHMMRHSFATHMLENGVDIETVREFLGHESLATTGIYLKMTMGHKKRAYDEAHPRDRMDKR
jgi:integrase/recombinase XerC